MQNKHDLSSLLDTHVQGYQAEYDVTLCSVFCFGRLSLYCVFLRISHVRSEFQGSEHLKPSLQALAPSSAIAT